MGFGIQDSGFGGRAARAYPLVGALLLAALLTGCGDSSGRARVSSRRGGQPDTVVATDDAGRVVRLRHPARRVVSLLPAGTEMLFALGAGDRVVGRTRYDVEPRVAGLPSVGGGLDPSLEALVSLHPELVIAFETAGASRIGPRIEALGIPVFAIRTEDTTDIYRDLRDLGHLVGRDSAAAAVLSHIRAKLDSVRASVPPGPRPSVVYVASLDPPVVAGERTFVSQLLGVAGAEPLRGLGSALWPQLSPEVLVHRQPDVVMLPVGADPASTVAGLRSAPGWRELRAVREGRIATVPADLADRPGPRIGDTAAAMRDAIRRVWGAR
ncbi:MAG TPA: helical backbone metal receptor [Longimicrobiaceae bacterium]|nr:helical backbone metal receptor [Longimicrobiaceae bacterium]